LSDAGFIDFKTTARARLAPTRPTLRRKSSRLCLASGRRWCAGLPALFRFEINDPAIGKAEEAVINNKLITVTRPYLPPLEEFIPYLEQIWESRWLTNNGPFHQQFEHALSEYWEWNMFPSSRMRPLA